MKAIFGILSLVIVLAVVGSLAKKQLEAVGAGGSAARNAAAASAAGVSLPADANGATVAQQARGMQERARADTARALQQGVERNQRADP